MFARAYMGGNDFLKCFHSMRSNDGMCDLTCAKARRAAKSV